MFVKYAKIALIAATASAGAACSTLVNGEADAISVEQAHPIAVDSQVVTLTLNVDPTTNELGNLDQARIRGFADAYLRGGHGPISVTSPSGASDDFDGQEQASDIRKYLHKLGVPWSSISGASYRTGDDQNRQVILSYTRYVATPSECGVWKGIRTRDYKNLRTPNFGCATQNNLAALVSDPRDLIQPANEGPADSIARIRAITSYREGTISATETDADIETQVAN
ncbi:MAG: CpaD family pilus assembly protein [Pseudomonadota bacterium]